MKADNQSRADTVVLLCIGGPQDGRHMSVPSGCSEFIISDSPYERTEYRVEDRNGTKVLVPKT